MSLLSLNLASIRKLKHLQLDMIMHSSFKITNYWL